ncbi:LytR/AlgR family response regulator transcription factor [Lysobacter sp. TAB13]|uniref:LytR/AlgR family response regulator transcription factor n=1 Tax=Lysobacter sp. TAB13 TaxID=3233065 RepID=UPI003F9A4BB0
MTAAPLRTLICEDEPLARESLVELVQGDARLELAGTAASGNETLAQIDLLQPTLVLLDIQMPGMSGIEALSLARHLPAVVFTTADPTHAAQAFDLGAFDYLLKPFGQARFAAAIERVVARMGPVTAPAPLKRLFVRHRDDIVPVRIAEVSRFEAQDDYVLVHAPGGPYWCSTPLSALEAKLDGERFVRVSRSHIVNLDRIERLFAHDARRLAIVMADGVEIIASRESSQRLRAAIT